MKTRIYWIFILLLTLSLVFTACGGDESETTVSEPENTEVVETIDESEPEAEVAEEEVQEPVEAVVEEVAETPVEISESSLNATFSGFLGNMVKYNTTGLEDVNLALVGDPPPFLLDVRQPEEAEEKGHIEGSVLIPLRELAQHLDLLPSFDTPIVTYCGSGWRATVAMTALQALGWQDVTVMKGGSYGGWVEAGYPIVEGLPLEGMVLNVAEPDPAMVAEMDEMLSGLPEGWGVITAENLNSELIENPNLVLIDVRRGEELMENGVIKADNELLAIPIEEFIEMKEVWPADKDADIVVYCGSGHRSTIAMGILNSYGYTHVRSLKGGFGGWAGEDYAVAGGIGALDDAYVSLLGNMVKYNTTGLEDVNLALAGDPPPFLLDVRQPAEAVEKGHIESAVLIPLRDLGKNLDLLPSFDTPVVIYCGSGWRATIAMTALQALGWEDVKVMKGGSYGGWVEAGYPIVEGVPLDGMVLNAAEPDSMMVARVDKMLSGLPEGWGVVTAEALNTELIEDPNLVLIDVRRSEELVENGVIEGANELLAIPIESFIEMKELWPADKDANIVVYCGSGHRSTMAMAILDSYGFTHVRSLKGGFGGWAGEGYPVAGGVGALDDAFVSLLGSMVKYNTTGLEDVNLALVGDPPPFLLDVRQPEEAEEKGHIESAVLIPLRELGKNLELLPSFDTPIVVYCGSGWRATIAMTALEALGWENVTVLKGGSYGGWVEAGYPIIEGLPLEGMVLNAAEPDPSLVAKLDEMLSRLPEGWGVITAENLNTELIEDPELILIDVRTNGELVENGVIATENELLAIPIEELVGMKKLWPADKEANIVVYCGSGHRSTIAMGILNSYGYSNVRSLKGGFGGWVGEDYSVTEFTTP